MHPSFLEYYVPTQRLKDGEIELGPRWESGIAQSKLDTVVPEDLLKLLLVMGWFA